MLGSAIEEFLTFKRGNEGETSSGSSSSGIKGATSPGKARTAGGKVAHWFSGGNKEDQQSDSCEPSLCSSLKDLFVK